MAESNFTPKPGQVDYRNIRYAPVVNALVVHNGKILLVKRSERLKLYPGCWNGISGFLDDHRSIEEKVREELREEVGIEGRQIDEIRVARPLLLDVPEQQKTWFIVPVLVNVSTNHISLDWESSEAKWYTFEETKSLRLVPGFPEVLAQFF